MNEHYFGKIDVLMYFMQVRERFKVKVTWYIQSHSKVIFEVIYNGHRIEVLDPTSIKGARTGHFF